MTAVARRRARPILVVGALAVCIAAGASALVAQDRRLVAPGAAPTERRVALIIGNAAYLAQPLRNPVNDAQAVGAALAQTGFSVDVVVNATFRDMARAVDRFIEKLNTGDVALLYYSGHGIQIDGENYLLPVDFDAKDEADAKYVSYSASRLHDRMSGKGARLKIMVLDACRNNPFRISRSMSAGLAQMSAGQGSFIGLATGPGSTADDNPNGKNGLFTAALLDALNETGLSLDQLFSNVRQKVYQSSNGRQTPWASSSVIGQFFFRPGNVVAPVSSADVALRSELLFWESVKDGRSVALFQEYLTKYGDGGQFSAIARERIKGLSPPVPVATTSNPPNVPAAGRPNPPATSTLIRRGMTPENVIAVIGRPTFQDSKVMRYGSSDVYLMNGVVNYWYDTEGVLNRGPGSATSSANAATAPPTIVRPNSPAMSTLLRRGMTPENVIAVLGRPTFQDSKVMRYGSSDVYLLNGVVNYWYDREGALNRSLIFGRGSTPGAVKRIQGPPDSETPAVMSYGDARVYFLDGVVNYWYDPDQRLRVR